MATSGAGAASTLADVGETGLLSRIFPLLPAGDSTTVGPGDDAAVLGAPDGRVVVTTDVLVEGRDFRRGWSSAEDVGRKAAAQNLADVAAMGAAPTGLVVSLVAPTDTEVEWVLGLARGLADGCRSTATGVVGGDLSSGSEIVVSVTALGDLQGRAPVLRSGARPGDVVALAGRVGRSAAGLALLEAGLPDVDAGLVAAHVSPEPPLAAGPAAAVAGATAMIDVSDGLLRDLGRVATASDVSADLDHGGPLGDLRSLLEPAASAVRGSAWEWVLTGGEDHALLACFPAGTPLPEPFVRIGTVGPAPVPGQERVRVEDRPEGPGGWDHFEAPAG